MVPSQQPDSARDMITRFIKGETNWKEWFLTQTPSSFQGLCHLIFQNTSDIQQGFKFIHSIDRSQRSVISTTFRLWLMRLLLSWIVLLLWPLLPLLLRFWFEVYLWVVLLLLVICSFEDLAFCLLRHIFHLWDLVSFDKLWEILRELLHTTSEQKDIAVTFLVKEFRGWDSVFLVNAINDYLLVWAVFLRNSEWDIIVFVVILFIQISGGVGRFGHAWDSVQGSWLPPWYETCRTPSHPSDRVARTCYIPTIINITQRNQTILYIQTQLISCDGHHSKLREIWFHWVNTLGVADLLISFGDLLLEIIHTLKVRGRLQQLGHRTWFDPSEELWFPLGDLIITHHWIILHGFPSL